MRKKKAVIFAGILLGCLALAAGLSVPFIKFFGERSLTAKKSQDGVCIRELGLQEGGIDPEEQITRDGRIYAYNEDLITILCMGIDKDTTVDDETDASAGQADCIILLVFDKKEKNIQPIEISRDSMTEVKMLDVFGNYVMTGTMQLTLSHSYGDGKEQSCELTTEAVSKMLYGLPIDGYCALNMGAVADLNDLVGGVEVEVLEHLYHVMPRLIQGETIVLTGEEAYHYTRVRECSIQGSNSLRMERQKQYVAAFVKKLQESMQKDWLLPLKAVREVREYLVTNLNLLDISYLTLLAKEGNFDLKPMRTVPGEIRTDAVYEEFYVDKGGLTELLLDVFYREVKEAS